MFADRRKRSPGCEQLEGRFAPSSFWVGGGSRSTLREAQALETTQAEQAAFYLAASAVVSQSSSMANVAPITFDQPTAGAAEESHDSESGGFSFPGFPMNCFPTEDWEARIHLCILVVSNAPQSTDGTESDAQNTGDTDVLADIPSGDPVSTETPSEQGDETDPADPVGAMPFEEQPADVNEVAPQDFPPVVDDTPVAGDEVAEPAVEDTGMPDASDAEEMPRCGNDFEDLGPSDPIHSDAEFTNADSSDEADRDAVPAETQADSAEVQGNGSLPEGQ